MAADQERLVAVPGKKRRHRLTIPMAMADDCIRRLQEIATVGTDADFLRMFFSGHQMFQPGPHEKNGDVQAPMPAVFVRAPESAPPPPETPPTTPAPAPGTLLGPDGQEYVG